MKRIIIYSILSACLIAVFPLSAQQTLNLGQCRELALENNKQMAIAVQNREKSSYDVSAYKANYLPKLSAGANYLYTSAAMEGGFMGGTLPLELELSNTYMANVALEQPIYMGGKIDAAYKMSRIGEQIAGLNEEKTRSDLILCSDEAYWTYVQALELEKTAGAYKNLVDKLLKDVENAYDAGVKPRNDLLKVQVKLNEAELQLMRAANGVRLSRMNLCHVIGLPLSTEIIAEESSESAAFANLPGADITARPEYAMLSKQIELKEQQVRLARSEFLPNVGVAGFYGYANGVELNHEKLLDNTSFSAVVRVGIPVFHWGEGRNKVKSAASERNAAALQRDEMSERMELELRRMQNQVDEARMEVMLTGRSMEQAVENLRESGNRYDAGMETLTDHLEAQALWQQARFDLIRSRTSARLSEIRYLKVAGQL